MSRLRVLSLIALMSSLSSGCAMCCAPFDYDYQSVTGRWTRTNRTSGRVGSLFDEAGGPTEVISTTPAVTEPIPSQLPAQMAPGMGSAIPRNMGETYLRTAP